VIRSSRLVRWKHEATLPIRESGASIAFHFIPANTFLIRSTFAT
jgi:hypothetical protein